MHEQANRDCAGGAPERLIVPCDWLTQRPLEEAPWSVLKLSAQSMHKSERLVDKRNEVNQI